MAHVAGLPRGLRAVGTSQAAQVAGFLSGWRAGGTGQAAQVAGLPSGWRADGTGQAAQVAGLPRATVLAIISLRSNSSPVYLHIVLPTAVTSKAC